MKFGDPINPTQIYTVVEASKLIGADRNAVMSAIKEKRLTAKKIGKGMKIVGINLLTFVGYPSE